jgi:hypothetical protein
MGTGMRVNESSGESSLHGERRWINGDSEVFFLKVDP